MIGRGTSIGNNVTISTGTTIGRNCSIFHSSSIGAVPQDLKYNNEETFLHIGDRTILESLLQLIKVHQH